MPILVVDYDAEWPHHFETLRARLWPAVADVAIAIEHVGSTSIPGIAAKPIIDLSIVVPSRADVPAAIERLERLGYQHRGDLGVPDREAFNNPEGGPHHNLYVCPQDTIGIVNQVTFRDHLRAHPLDADRYAALKKTLAQRCENIDAYVAGKTDFVLDVLRRAGLTDEQLATIERANRPQQR
jgi:GrpB-like predicted nucleotidyltransferase (UPF0157 family)